MNSEIIELTKLADWYKNSSNEMKTQISQIFEGLNFNLNELSENKLDEISRKNINELCAIVWNALNQFSTEKVEDGLINNGFDEKLSKLIIDYALRQPSAKRDAKVITALKEEEFETVTKLVFFEAFLKGDINSWEDFITKSKINSEAAEAILRFIKSLSSKVCCREIGIVRTLVEDYGLTEIRAKFLISLIKENIDVVEKIFLMQSIEHINSILIDVHKGTNYILDKIDK